MQVDAAGAPSPPDDRPGPGPHHWVRGVRALRVHLPPWATVLCWTVVAAMVVVVVARVVAWDALEPFAVLDAVTAFVYLPAYAVLVVAAVARNAALGAAALVVVVAQVVFLLPELTAAQSVPGWTTGAPVIRLFDANVYSGNPSMAGYARRITSLDPDVVTLEEADPPDVDQLVYTGALDRLPYRIQIRRYGSPALLVAARYPLTHANAVYDHARRPIVVQAELQLPTGPVALWVVHTIAPLPSSFAEWRDDLGMIAGLVRHHGPGRLLVVGDFNATWGNKGFRAILDGGLTDAAAARGHALSMTWSQIEPVVPPLVRIDHVLTGTGIAVTTVVTQDGPGSDHRAVFATVAVRR